MRLQRLLLTRYGKFTDACIAFGARPNGPDLHLVYGANEAGKSTARSALVDFLFGIEPRSRFAFRHSYATMQIGAVVENGSALEHLVRVKHGQTLQDEAGRPATGGVLAAALGAIDRKAYELAFSLDAAALEEGGREILQADGELGRLLFAASAGLAGISRKLDEIGAEIETFHKPRARKTRLAELRQELEALDTEKKTVDVQAGHYRKLREARAAAAEQYEAATAELGRLRAAGDALRRRLTALPRRNELLALRDELLPLQDLPPAPEGWSERVVALRDALVELAATDRALAERAQALDTDIERLVVDEAVLERSERVRALVRSGERYRQASDALPTGEADLRALDATSDRLLRDLGHDGHAAPVELLLPATTTGRLRDLLEQRSGIEAAVTAARAAMDEARARLADAEAALERHAGEAPDPSDRAVRRRQLANALTTMKDGNLRFERHAAERAVLAKRATLDESLRALHPWRGNADTLARLEVPGRDRLLAWRSALADARTVVATFDAEARRLAEHRARLDAEIEAIETTAGVVTDQAAADVRTARDEAWAVHRRTLDAATADTFEQALRRDDAVTGARFQHADDRAKLNQLARERAVLAVESERVQARLDEAAAARDGLLDETREALRAIVDGFDADDDLRRFEAWLADRERALQAGVELKAAERDLAGREAALAQGRDSLVQALRAAGLASADDDALDHLTARAEAAIERIDTEAQLAERVHERRSDLEHRAREQAEADAHQARWDASWTDACATSWLGAGARERTPAEVRAILEVLGELGPLLDKRAALAARIASMKRDLEAFASDGRALAAELAMAASDVPPVDLAHRIDERLDRAREIAAARAKALADRADVEDRQRQIAEERRLQDDRAQEITAYFEVSDLAEAQERLRAAEAKAGLLARVAAVERELRDGLRAASVEAALEALADADPAALGEDEAALDARIADQERVQADLHGALVRATEEMDRVGADDRVAKLEARRRHLMLEMEEGALRHLRLSLGKRALEQALQLYRERHRSSMMARAGEAFRAMTCGAYVDLTTQLDGEREILIALGADGSARLTQELSEGTQHQLYLALRVAAYLDVAERRPPLPFVCDDVLASFDDDRAAATLALFAQMAGAGQVVYFTHHAHLCAIAERVVPGVRIHQLGG